MPTGLGESEDKRGEKELDPNHHTKADLGEETAPKNEPVTGLVEARLPNNLDSKINIHLNSLNKGVQEFLMTVTLVGPLTEGQTESAKAGAGIK